MDIDMNVRALVGSGDRIGLVTLPFLVVGVVLNIAFPAVFTVGDPPRWLGVLSVLVLLVGVVNWGWCVYLLLTKVRRGELITNGPYAVVKHPLYTGGRAPGPAVAWFSAQHLARRRDRDCALCRIADVCPGRGGGVGADVRRRLGRLYRRREAALVLTPHLARPGRVTKRSTWPGIGGPTICPSAANPWLLYAHLVPGSTSTGKPRR
jgi:hypothetical protein